MSRIKIQVFRRLERADIRNQSQWEIHRVVLFRIAIELVLMKCYSSLLALTELWCEEVPSQKQLLQLKNGPVVVTHH